MTVEDRNGEIARAHEFFDADYYLKHNPDVAEAGVDPFGHYINVGWREGRDPNAVFSTVDYCEVHPELASRDEAPIFDYLRQRDHLLRRALQTRAYPSAKMFALKVAKLTKVEFTQIERLFDVDFYLRRNPEVAEAGVDPLLHFMILGRQQSRDPSPWFSIAHYRQSARNEDDLDLVNPVLHYLREGRSKGYQPAPLNAYPSAGFYLGRILGLSDSEVEAVTGAFDAAYYLEQNTDVSEAGLDPLLHYVVVGWREGRDPSPYFSTRFYLQADPMLVEAGVNPLIHYVRHGKAEGRVTRSPFHYQSAKDYAAQVLRLDAERFARVAAHVDCDFYYRMNPDVINFSFDPVLHYLAIGWREGRDPSEEFSTRFYQNMNPELTKANVNPLVHFVLHGEAEGRQTLPISGYATAEKFAARVLKLSHEEFERVERLFKPAHYRRENPDIAEAGIDPLLHYLAFGWCEARDPSADFSTRYYLEHNPEIRDAGLNPFVHYALHGKHEGRLGRDPDQDRKIDLSQIDWSDAEEDEIATIGPFFDRAFYLASYPEVADLGCDPIAHYLLVGWRQGYNPRADFSTRYYLRRHIDIRRSGMNPFVHYCRSGKLEQREVISYIERAKDEMRPLVSVIVPNYNHARFLPQRLRSIADQCYDNIELIILDDVSTDDSREVIQQTVNDLGLDARLEFNDVNSGSVFKQWRKGLSLAKGELIWICESDDFCEPDFLEKLIPAFADESVNIAFGRIQFSDSDGAFKEGLDAYRESAEPGIWDAPFARPASQWFNGGFGVSNVIANVGGCLFRNMKLPDAVWEEARNYRICGDWYLYAHVAGTGQIAYHPDAVAYFRQHAVNTSASNFDKAYYYDELIRILRELTRLWGIEKSTRQRFLHKVRFEFEHFKMNQQLGDFGDVYPVDNLLKAERETRHVQIFFLGFHLGGGELFPINLANALLEAGEMVSMVAMDMLSVNPDIRAKLDRRIPVYHGSHLTDSGRAEFFDNTGVSLINSHMVSCDTFLVYLDDAPVERPWVVTLHGSYVGLADAGAGLTERILDNVTSWVYVADRNLEFFADRDIPTDGFIKITNSMPRDERPSPFTRAEMGIGADDVVFTMAARGIKRKGWRAAVTALRKLRDERGITNVHLLMAGDGEASTDAQEMAEAADLPQAHFLGYQSAINGIMRLSDCVILPSRFEGESDPLCLIQALQEGRPVIATDIGEIRTMLDFEGKTAGRLLLNRRDSQAYFEDLTDAMAELCNKPLRTRLAKVAKKCGSRYEMSALVDAYGAVFDGALAQGGAE